MENNQKHITKTENGKGVITLIFVCGLPGIGKSTFFQEVTERWMSVGYNVVKVESDIVRQEAIRLEKLKIQNADLTPLELEIQSKPVYTKMLHEFIRDEIEDLSETPGDSIFILDKNYVPETLREVIFDAAKEFFGENYRSFFILPQQSYDPELTINVDGKVCPFYLDTLCASMIRVFTRKGHLSLCHGYSHSLKCIVGVVRAYSGQSFEEIAEKYNMKLLHLDYFNCDQLQKEPVRTSLLEKMLVIHEMIKNEDYDGDKCAELLFSDPELAKIICTYDNFSEKYMKVALDVENSK